MAALALASIACAPRPRMCTASTECAAQSACVAGRCQPDRPNVKPAIDTARRLVVRPVDLGYASRRGGAEGVPPLFTLGRDSAVLFLRFAVTLPATANVIEAYVVLHRSDAVDDDPAPISLHATRIVDDWQGRSISWGTQPRQSETRAPSTLVEPSGPALVRLDVRDLVRQWPKHDPRDHGIAVVADNESRTGTTFALLASGAERSAVAERTSSAPDLEPYLELYLR
jgi:hypothetical protein